MLPGIDVESSRLSRILFCLHGTGPSLRSRTGIPRSGSKQHDPESAVTVEGPALVTGATGFVGSHLTRRLISDGLNVHIITRPGSSLSLLEDVAARLSNHVHDGTTLQLMTILREVQPKVVFHLAAAFDTDPRSAGIDALIEANVRFATQLVEAMVHASSHALVNTGTAWQHFENAPVRPVSLYAATKQAFEDILSYYTDATPLRAISLHLFDTYGPRDPRPKLFRFLTRVAASGDSLPLSGGEQHLDLVHVDDVVEAYLTAAQLLRQGRVDGHVVYAVGTGQTLTLRALVELFGRVNGSPLSVRWGARPYRDREVMRPWTTGTPVPGWRPRVTLEGGIAEMLRDARLDLVRDSGGEDQ